MTKLFSIPTFERTIAGFNFTWPDLAVAIELQRMGDDAKGEIGVYHQNGDGRDLLRYSRVSLLDSRGMDSLAKSLSEHNNADLDWRQIMTYVTAKTVQALRTEVKVENISCAPNSQAITYALYPLLPENEPTTIFGPGGKGKSVLADLVSVIVSHNVRVPGLSYLRVPDKGNVLYLDWESDKEAHRQHISAIKNALGIEGDETIIHYIKCEHPITSLIDSLIKMAAELHTTLVIVDSQMAATAGVGSGKSDAEVSSEYYNTIRRFNCTTLTIDHTTKAGANDTEGEGDRMPFGSIVKWNRARSIYNIEAVQETESDSVYLRLKHQKFNLGRKQADRGIEIEFVNESDKLTKIHFRSFDLAQHTAFSKKLPEWQVIRSILESEGPKACSDIADSAKELNPETKLDAKRVYDVLNQHRRIFAQDKESRRWGLVDPRDG